MAKPDPAADLAKLAAPDARPARVAKVAARLQDLTTRANGGDVSALATIREMVAACPAVATAADLAAHARALLVNRAAGADVVLREALLRKLEDLRADLAGPDPPPLERLLVDRIVSAWLYLHYLETVYPQCEARGAKGGDHCQRQIDRAHRRYLAAIRTLATVRKLAAPWLQVNVAAALHSG